MISQFWIFYYLIAVTLFESCRLTLYWVNILWILLEPLNVSPSFWTHLESWEGLEVNARAWIDSLAPLQKYLRFALFISYQATESIRNTLTLVCDVHNWTKNSFEYSITGKSFSVLQKSCFVLFFFLIKLRFTKKNNLQISETKWN